MRKFIAGFRSDNPKNKKIAIIYYVLVTLIFTIASSRSLNDVVFLLLLLATPSLVFNFTSLILKRENGNENKKIFLITLIVYIGATFIFYITTPKINESTADSQLLGENNVEKDSDDISKDFTNEEEVDEQSGNTSEDESTSIKEAELHFIDTGNSDAILIIQGDKAALIDGGDNDDEERVVSYLKNAGVTELEYIFATHPDADHIGGLDAVVNSIPVKNMYVSNRDASTKTYSDFINAMANKGVNPSVPLLNSEFNLGSSKFKVLSVANEKEPNNNSIVLEYTNGNDNVLLMGDAGSEIENKINVSDVDLIKIGHHGSHSSSSSSFINKINPEYAVITVGKNNKYGHPHKETMDTLKSNNLELHRSDECGNIIFKSSGNGLSVDCKEGSYNSGSKKESSSSSSNNSSSSSPVVNQNQQQTTVESQITSNEGIVYWTPNGKSYHTTKSCSTLSRSKIINSGTQSQSGKSDPCDRCH